MYRVQCVLALVALYLGLAHSWSGSWDVATVSSNGMLKLFNNGKKVHFEAVSSKIDICTYDVVYKRLFYSDSSDMKNLIFSYNIATKITEILVPRSKREINVGSMALDPVQELLFWSCTSDRNIYSFSLKPGSENNRYGNVVITTSAELPTITVDSCKGYIYWTSIDRVFKKVPSTIERARFDGSEREVVINSNLDIPNCLAIDQQTQKLYWSDGTNSSPSEDSYFSIESADLDGKNRIILYNETRIGQPTTIVASKDSIYWGHWFTRIVKQITKNPSTQEKPKEIRVNSESGLFTNYKIADQIKGIKECKPLESVLTNDSVTDDSVSLNISLDMRLFCVHGILAGGKTRCECLLGYTGERCDVSVCQNYCFQGDCSASAEGQPRCGCYDGYSGERCEVNQCQGYCLNKGVCSLNGKNEPVCQCEKDYEGERCEVSVCLNKCVQKLASIIWGTINAVRISKLQSIIPLQLFKILQNLARGDLHLNILLRGGKDGVLGLYGHLEGARKLKSTSNGGVTITLDKEVKPTFASISV